MDLKDKSVVITGGSDGLGLALTKTFVQKGAKVYIIGRNTAKLDSVVKDLGNNVTGCVADVSKYDQIEKIAADIKSVDILINNAGVWIEGSVLNNSVPEISAAIDTNLKGVIYVTKAFLPLLQKSPEAHIINISSTSGLKGRENQSVYAASKFGVTGFTESLKVDLANTNIKVGGFYPGGMNTRIFAKANNPKANSDWMDTAKVAEIIAFMVEQDLTMVMDHVVLNKRSTKTTN